MLYLLSALSVMYILLMYYISLLLLPPDGFVLCYIGLLVLMLWRFDDDVISPSPGKGRYYISRNVRFNEDHFPFGDRTYRSSAPSSWAFVPLLPPLLPLTTSPSTPSV